MIRLIEAFLSKVRKLMLYKYTFIAITIIYCVACISIIRADYNYIDDLGRVAQGYRGWDNFSRFSSQALSIILHADSQLSDISPLTQLIAIILLGLSSTILVVRFSVDSKFKWKNIIAVLPLGLSPYFLECISYKFDSPYMALSVFASIFPLLFIHSERLVYFTAIFLGTLIMCTTYQASSGIFIISVLFYLLYCWNNGEELRKCIKSFVVSVAGYIGAMFTFKTLIMKPVDEYVSSTLPEKSDIIIVLLQNITQYYRMLVQDSTKLWIILFLILCICFVYSVTVSSVKNKVGAFFLAIMLLGIGSVVSYGAYIILTKPLFAPRAMYGFGAFIALIGLVTVNSNAKNYIALFTSIGIAWTFFVFTFIYGNALAEQKRYTNFRVQLVLNDISRLPHIDNEHMRSMQIHGNIGKSPVVKRLESRYKILRRLVPNTFGGGWWWSEYYIYNYFALSGIKQKYNDDKNFMDEEKISVFSDTCYHTIKADEKNIVVILK